MYIVYCHTNRLNKKPYIGWAIIAEGQTPHDAMMRRWEVHCKNNRPDLFPRAIQKWGTEAWDHEVLDVVTKLETAKHVERLWIAQRKTCVFDVGGHGYNMTRGGDGGGMLGHVPTQEHRENLSKALTGKPKSAAARKNMRLAKLGTISNARGSRRSPEWCAAHTGENSANHRLTQAQKLVIVARWENRANAPVTQHQLAREHGVTQSTVCRLLNGKTWKQ